MWLECLPASLVVIRDLGIYIVDIVSPGTQWNTSRLRKMGVEEIKKGFQESNFYNQDFCWIFMKYFYTIYILFPQKIQLVMAILLMYLGHKIWLKNILSNITVEPCLLFFSICQVRIYLSVWFIFAFSWCHCTNALKFIS